MARSVSQWIEAYGVCHQNPTNKRIHYLCVPVIMLTLLAMLWTLPVPTQVLTVIPGFNWSVLVVLLCLVFYLRLSWTLAIGMAVISGLMLTAFFYYDQQPWPALWIPALIIFVLAWILQFIGHKIEGAKPAFLEDLQFLLIGPIWILARIYRQFRISI